MDTGVRAGRAVGVSASFPRTATDGVRAVPALASHAALSQALALGRECGGWRLPGVPGGFVRVMWEIWDLGSGPIFEIGARSQNSRTKPARRAAEGLRSDLLPGRRLGVDVRTTRGAGSPAAQGQMAGLGWPAQPLCGNVTDVMRVAVSQAEQPAVAGAAPCVVRVAGRIRVLAGLPGRVTPIYLRTAFR
jgi:hypothetical protein